MSNAWKQDMCGCCGDCTVCWYALCCGPCQVCDMATALQKSGCCYCLLGTIGLPCLPIFLLRAEARRRYDIAVGHGGGAPVTIKLILAVLGQLLLRLSGRLLLHGVCPVSARGRDPGAGPQAAGDAAASHDAARDAAACDDAACDAAARDDGPADADDDATLKSQTFVAATALILINESIAI